MNIDDERSAGLKAQEVLSTLTTTPRTEKILNALRHAARFAADSSRGFSSQAALDNIRGQAAAALNGVAGSLDKGQLSQAMIDGAKTAVDAWLAALESASGA
jgi:hypothetical protein